MKILVVPDWRKYTNWGSRGTSIAFSRLLAGRGHRVTSIPAEYAKREAAIGTLLPAGIAGRLHAQRSRYVACRAYSKLERMLGGRFDYLDADPAVSVRNILRHHARVPDLDLLVRRVREADAVVVNGEGELVFSSQYQRRLTPFMAALIELARQLGKPAYFVNGMISDCTQTGRNEEHVRTALEALRKCAAVAVRDPASLALLRELAPDLDAVYIPDVTFAWYPRLAESAAQVPANGDFILPWSEEEDEFFGTLDFSRPYLCVAGGTRAAWNIDEAVAGYAALVEDLKALGLPIYLVVVTHSDAYLYEVSRQTGCAVVPARTSVLMGGAILANARLLVSGRYHPIIYAGLGGTPAIALGCESHKTLSVQTMLEYDDPMVYSYVPTAEEHAAIQAHARRLLEQGEALRARIRAASKRRGAEVEQLPRLFNRNGRHG